MSHTKELIIINALNEDCKNLEQLTQKSVLDFDVLSQLISDCAPNIKLLLDKQRSLTIQNPTNKQTNISIKSEANNLLKTFHGSEYAPRNKLYVEQAMERSDMRDAEVQWFLSFDPATKTFAWALIRYQQPGQELLDMINSATNSLKSLGSNQILQKLISINRVLDSYFVVVDGATVDLCPGVPDKKINAIKRITAAKKYLAAVVDKSLELINVDKIDYNNFKVLVEYQMNANAYSKTIADIIISHYVEKHDVIPVGPLFKNKIIIKSRPDLSHCMFYEKYSSTYTANKKHSETIYFEFIKPLLSHKWIPTPKNKKDDFADCVTQVIGCIQYADFDELRDKF
jgi:hypothetical protein